jgi:carboxymethylenebutenolidase
MAELVPIPNPGEPLAFGPEDAPIVALLHDAYGRLPWLVTYAEAMADRGGLRVIVPDYYDGYATVDGPSAVALSTNVDELVAEEVLTAALESARIDGTQRVGIVGWGWGGQLALRAGQRGEADAVVAYDATLGADDPGILPCPVLLHLPESASWEDGAEPEVFMARVRDNGTPVTSHVYTGTVPGFANATMRELVDGRAAALAFARTTVFLESRLKD